MPHRPEILAPAGDPTALKAALAAGADAVYFGLDEGFNARARARNFPLAELPETVAQVHRAGAKAYVTMNTLVFEPELGHAERVLRGVAAAGADAIIVQDPAIALLAREICPDLHVHASTQMTIASPAAAELAGDLGVTRVVVPRELSIAEIRAFATGTELELEVFVHGALCMSWSGQCLTSEAWGGRSANRGQCAQSCRLPYDLVVDGEVRDLGEITYLLSPKDLAGLPVVPDLAEIGISSLKIEGRQKSAEYVSTAVGGYRRSVDGLGSPSKAPATADERGVASGRPASAVPSGADGSPLVGSEGAAAANRKTASADLEAMALTYSRGFGTGFFEGSDHQRLVDGRFPKHRGLFLGTVIAVRGDEVEVEGPEIALRPGMGVVFDAGDPADKHEAGGPLFRVSRIGSKWRLGFGRVGPDLGRVAPGQRVWATSDPATARAVEKAVAHEPEGRVPVDLAVSGRAGEPLVVTATAGHASVTVRSSPLAEARQGGLGEALLAEKLGAFGGTPFTLGALDLSGLSPGLHLAPSELKSLRRALVEGLLPAIERGPARILSPEGAADRVRMRLAAHDTPGEDGPAQLIPLCRSDEQLEAVIEAGLPEVELDWMELVGLGNAVERARQAGLRITLATLRVTKPGEEPFDERIWKLQPDAILVRHWGALERFRSRGGMSVPSTGGRPAGSPERPSTPPLHWVGPEGPTRGGPVLHGDFSLNVTNSITARFLLQRGLSTVTASFDLDETQLDGLLGATPAHRVTVMVYHRIPTFHTEHCVYAHLLSEGRDYKTCGRPCEKHRVSLRDPASREHPVIVDAACRNTVFNHATQSAAKLVPRLLERGVRRFRVQLVRETRAEALAVLRAHQDLLRGDLAPASLVERLQLSSQFGVGVSMSTMMNS